MWEKITARVPVLSDALLDLIRIEHGVPRWGRELDETTLPPEAGLDRTHVDFHKGCYIGQEVISRLKQRRPCEPRTARLRLRRPACRSRQGARIFSAADPCARSRPHHERRIQFRTRPSRRARLSAQGCCGRGISSPPRRKLPMLRCKSPCIRSHLSHEKNTPRTLRRTLHRPARRRRGRARNQIRGRHDRARPSSNFTKRTRRRPSRISRSSPERASTKAAPFTAPSRLPSCRPAIR